MKVVRGEDLSFEPASHENPQSPGCLKKVLAAKADFVQGQIQMLNWSVCPAGSAFVRHYHEDMQEVFVVLDGSVRMEVGDESVDLAAGDAVLIDAREVHKMYNTCEHDVNYIVFGVSTGQGGRTIAVE